MGVIKLKNSLLFLIVFTSVLAEKAINLCGNKKTNDTCVCRYVFFSDKRTVLSTIDCSAVNIPIFPSANNFSQEPQILDLSLNQIKVLNGTVQLKELKVLDLSHNSISYISNLFFEELNLEELDLSYNEIEQFENDFIFEPLTNLKVLDLSFNKISWFSDKLLAPLINLKSLNLSYNDLSTIIDLTQPLKETLFLSESLTTLNLDKVGLKDFDENFFISLDSLTHLSLAENDLARIPHIPPAVKYLDLSGNLIAEITNRDFIHPSLEELKLNRLLRLTSIQIYSFYHLPRLQKLWITDCPKLKYFDPLLVGDLEPKMSIPLRELHLTGNGFKTLHEDYAYLIVKLDHIDLTNNPWTCNCSLLWLGKYKKYLYQPDRMRCAFPKRLLHRQLFALSDPDLEECHPEKYGKSTHRMIIFILFAAVITLAVLIVYLIYYAPFKIKKPSKNVSPTSPYYGETSVIDDL